MGTLFSVSDDETISNLYLRLCVWKPTASIPHFSLTRQQLTLITTRSIEILSQDPILLDLPSPIHIIGDIHGKISDLQQAIHLGGSPHTHRYLFLGDYVDRGKNSIECLTLLLLLKILYRHHIFLLRGNHEIPAVCQTAGFHSECITFQDESVWRQFTEVFRYLPLAAVIQNRVFCVHGGISPSCDNIKMIHTLMRPFDVPAHGMAADFLWSDPSPIQTTFAPSPRGSGFLYGKAAVEMFFAKTGMKMICRAHQFVPDGIDFPFEPDRSVVTVFSSTSYCEHADSCGAILTFDGGLKWVCRYFGPPGFTGKLPGAEKNGQL